MPVERTAVNTAFGAVLKGVVRENGKTQQGVADRLGVNVVTINRIFNGRRDITVEQFFQIADYCDESPELILSRVQAKLTRVSVPDSNVVPLKPIEKMTDDEVEELQGAATYDEELERDEPDPT